MLIFKVWSSRRDKKTFVVIKEEDNLVLNLIARASSKMEINGSTLVLENDGTEITEDEVLLHVKDQTLILLQPEEQWQTKDDETGSQASTITLNLDDSLNTMSPSHHVLLENADFDEANIEWDKENRPTDTGVTFDEPILISIPPSGNKTRQITEFTWREFKIPWEKIPHYMLEECEKGKVDKRIFTEIIHVVVNEMRAIKTHIPNVAYRVVAQKLIDKYPLAFLDRDEDGTIIGSGDHSIVSKLLERGNYLNRPHKRAAGKLSSPNSPVTAKLAKKVSNSKAGCSNWQPPPSLKVTNQDNEDIRNLLKNIDENNPNFYAYLEQTYAEQRSFINKIDPPPTASQIKEEWPVLLKNSAVLWHFKKLTGAHCTDDDLETKCKKILQFGEKKKINLTTNENGTGDVLLKTLEVLCHYFKESFTSLVYSFKDIEPTDKQIYETVETLEPCILEIEKINQKLYYVLLEKNPLASTATNSFKTAFQICFALYYNFDLMYPQLSSVTLEFVQRYFYKIHPDSGSKSKKMSSSKKKVINLINSLSTFNPTS